MEAPDAIASPLHNTATLNRQGSSRLRHFILKRSNGIDSNANPVSACQREGIGRNDTGSSHQECAEGKAVISEEVFDESCGFALQLGKCCGAGELYAAVALNLDANWGSD